MNGPALEEMGQLEVEIGDRVYTLSPDYRGLMFIEQQTGKGLSSLVDGFMANKLGMTEIVAIIYGGIIGAHQGDPGVSIDFIGNQVMRAGYHNFVEPCCKFLLAAQSGKSLTEINEKWKSSTEEKKRKPQSPLKAPETKVTAPEEPTLGSS
jgi:hypothetical protein